ncbi:MAG: citrate transporter, partial [Clostridiales bacterium]|nr:citrate transporter [Clostridiales bacterium]
MGSAITTIHIIYLLGVVCILLSMALRKEAVFPCIIFIFLIGLVGGQSVIAGIQAVFQTILHGAINFMDIIVTITLVTALSKLLNALGSDRIMMEPGARIIKSPSSAYWIIGITMMVASFFLWPSPVVALIGTMLLPIAVKVGLPAMSVAIAMNIFGHGIALSSDLFIQGAPSITADAAGLSPSDITMAGIPLFITMSVVTSVAAFLFLRKSMVKSSEPVEPVRNGNSSRLAIIVAIATPLLFVGDIVAMFLLDLKGGDASSLVGGTALLILCAASVAAYKKDAFDNIAEYLRQGFLFGIKIFSSVIVIGGFFFLGGEGITSILGENFAGYSGILSDL